MAATELGTRLTQLHANAQANLSASVQRDLLTVWDLLDPEDIDGTEARWLQAASRILTDKYRLSVETSVRYLQAFRLAELGASLSQGWVPTLPALLPPEQITTSLRVTGPYTLKRLTAEGLDVATARGTALTRVLGSGGRLAMAGGRSAIDTNVQADRRALGYQRVTRSGACAFCALLAGRGPVYKSERSAGGDGHRYHDYCHCQTEPVYSRSSALPESSAAYRKAYDQAEGRTLKEKVASMRQILGSH